MKKLWALLIVAGVLFHASNVAAENAVFAGGCFWCMEADFEKVKGVSDVVSGFTGGSIKNPTYNGRHDGHYESVLVTYDPKVVSYQQLLDYYWMHIDPFDDKGQFCDKGHTYLSAIFVANKQERALAEASRKKLAALFPDKKIATAILDRSTFYPIKGDESYHQDYYKKNPVRYKFYRFTCGRDRRVHEIWGDKKIDDNN